MRIAHYDLDSNEPSNSELDMCSDHILVHPIIKPSRTRGYRYVAWAAWPSLSLWMDTTAALISHLWLCENFKFCIWSYILYLQSLDTGQWPSYLLRSFKWKELEVWDILECKYTKKSFVLCINSYHEGALTHQVDNLAWPADLTNTATDYLRISIGAW